MLAMTSSLYLLAWLAGIGLLLGVLFQLGVVGWLLWLVNGLLHRMVYGSYQVWSRFLSWAPWPLLLLVLIGAHVLALYEPPDVVHVPGRTLIVGIALVVVGVITSLAYIYIDLERYAVSRGHKVLFNPLKGQELAVHLIQHGERLGFPLLVVATLGMISGFALLNQGLYETVGSDWYIIGLRAQKESIGVPIQITKEVEQQDAEGNPAEPPKVIAHQTTERRADRPEPDYSDFL